jgi:TolB-like protein
MKKAGILGFLALFVGFVLLATSACSSMANTKSSSEASNSYYTGDGGKDMSLAILVPEAQGLGQDENDLPTLIQSVFVGDLSKFSAMPVLDRQNLEKVLKETESGIYKNEQEFVQLGEIANVRYAMTGNLTKTRSGFSLSVAVTDTKTGMTRAAYNGACTTAELVNFTGIRKASLDLLTQMGVELTARAKKELSGASAAQQVNAERALAKGIVAQKGGDEFNAWINFFEAKSFDNTLTEATTRMASNSGALSGSTGTGDGLRNQFQNSILQERERLRSEAERKKAIEQVLTKATEFYKDHPPVRVTSNNFFATSNLNYQKETVDISVTMNIAPVSDEFKIISQLAEQARSVGYGNWPFGFNQFKGSLENNFFLGVMLIPLLPTKFLRENREMNDESFKASIWDLYAWSRKPQYGKEFYTFILLSNNSKFTIVADILNPEGRKIKRISFPLELSTSDDFIRVLPVERWIGSTSNSSRFGIRQGQALPSEHIVGGSNTQTFTVKVDDLTDNLTLKIISINGKNVGSGYVGIDQETKILKGR